MPLTRLLLLSLLLQGCASAGGGSTGSAVDAFLGSYEGSFASALSPQADDDLNACPPEELDCANEFNPLTDIVLRLTQASDGKLAAQFYQHPQDLQPLDLLGRGCGTSVGALQALTPDTTLPDQRYTARFGLNIENRLCAGRLRPTSSHYFLVRLFENADGERSAEVVIDKSVTSANYMYVKEDGVERKVRIDVDNTPENARRGGYRVCIEDAEGEYTRCVITDKELKQFFLPVPIPGGAAANYTWWYDLNPNLKRTRDLYTLEQYIGRFEQMSP
jgi:hypothetical protein